MEFGSKFRLPLLLVVGCLLFVNVSHAQEVDILWQGETYAPPFYKGMPIWGVRSLIKLVAIPQDVTKIDHAQAMYLWSKNGTKLGNYNAIGKNYLTFADSPYRQIGIVGMELVTRDFLPLAEKEIRVSPRSQRVLIYEDHPLYGLMLHREVGEKYEVGESEVTFAAIPLYFDTDNRNADDIEYEWRAGGNTLTGSSITYRAVEDSKGTSQISVRINKNEVLLQSARKAFLLEFK